MSDNGNDSVVSPASENPSGEESSVDSESFGDLQAIFDTDDSGLLDAPEKQEKVTSADRLQRSFLEIVEFVREHDREPGASTHEIAERKLGARLDGIRMSPEKAEALVPLDEFGLLSEFDAPASLEDLLDADGLGLLDDPTGLLDTSSLPQPPKRPAAAESIAKRERCEDFDRFQPLFAQKQGELSRQVSKLVTFTGRRAIKEGAFFVAGGVMLFVAEIGEASVKIVGGKPERRERLRVIFENGTESAMYLKSLSILLYQGGDGFQVVAAEFETLLADDEATGWIYILRSLSDDPAVASRQNLYKIGFSTTPVKKRIANAVNEPTYLMAPVEIVAEYRTYNMKTSALEHLLHRVFTEVRLDINQIGTNGRRYDSTEWFEVQLSDIDQAIELITSGDIVDYNYNGMKRELEFRMD